MNTKLSTGRKVANITITVLLLLTVICIAYVVINKVTIFRTSGSSMNPTLKNSELVIAKPKKNYERGDIVAFENKGEVAIKRIIGLPGEKIFIDEDGKVFINDKELEEKYVKELYKGDVETSNPCILGKDEYYLLGDNRIDSKDSRLVTVGPVSKKQIKDKIYYSISNFKVIK